MTQVKIFDTTLRDGEQSPGCSMNLKEKLEVAKCLERLRVDVMEAGFPMASAGDFAAVNEIAKMVKDCQVAALARCTSNDIDAAVQALEPAVAPRIHLFLATSPIHMQYKLRMTEEQVLERAKTMVAYARKRCPDVEFSCEDASRSDMNFLVRMVQCVIDAGATTINLPDTVGYATPWETEELFRQVRKSVVCGEDVVFAVHGHNDLGMAVANSLAGVRGGARQIECTINGLGERAGNASLEEVVMALKTRHDTVPFETKIDTTLIYRASQTVYNIIGQKAPMNKPIVGRNAFIHEAGIHQHGVMANKATYEIMTPESIGIRDNALMLGKHSGRHAFEEYLTELGYRLTPELIGLCFEQFKALCDRKKEVNDADLRAIVTHNKVVERVDTHVGYELVRFVVYTSNFTSATSTVSLKKGREKMEEVALGDGPVDAAFKAIDQIVKPKAHTFDLYTINSISEGKDTMGDVMVKLKTENHTYTGRGLSTDIIEASLLAYLSALNQLVQTEPN